jgi:hypothetical protein
MSDEPDAGHDPGRRVRVAFIGGQGRSGSTVLENLLERLPGVVSVGEIRFLFSRALGDNELCGCGQPFDECTYWRDVLDRAFPDGFDRERIQRAVRSLNSVVRTPQVMYPRLMTPALRADAAAYGDAFVAVFRAVQQINDAAVIVDSSKYPLHALFLHTRPEIDLSAIHLVRDPRAVAYSWTRRKVRTEVHWEKREFKRHAVVRTAVVWDVLNFLTRRLKSRSDAYRLLRYEDFVANPLEHVQQLAAFVLRRPVPIDDSIFGVQSRTPHTISGNPSRAGGGAITVRADESWRESLSGAKKATVTALTAIPLRRYGYDVAASRTG